MNNEIELNPTPKGSADLNSLLQGNVILDSLPKGCVPVEVPPASQYSIYLNETKEVYDNAMSYRNEINNTKNTITNIQSDISNKASQVSADKNTVEQKATEASNSALQAKQYMEGAFSATPTGYQALVEEVKTQSAELAKKADSIECETDTAEINVANDCSNLPLRKLVVEGRSEQAQYSGKNLLEEPNANWQNYNQYTVDTQTYLGQKVFTKSTSWSGVKREFYVNKDEVYTFSIYAKSEQNNASAVIYFYAGNEIKQDTANVNVNYKEITVGNTWNRYTVTCTVLNSGYIYPRLEFKENVKQYISCNQLEKGSTATDYESYVGGMPSPSPDFPQSIKNVADNGELVETVLGKNLIDKSKISNGYITASGDIEINTIDKTSDFIKVNPNTQYTFSAISLMSTTGVSFRVAFYNKNKNFISRTLNYHNITENKKSSDTITTDNNTEYIKVMNNINYFSVDTWQFEKGDVATDYVPYVPQQSATIVLNEPLRSIGDYKDILTVNADGSGVIERKVGKLDLKNVSWRYTVTNNNNVCFANFANSNICDYLSDQYPFYCNFLIYKGVANGYQSALDRGSGLFSYMNDDWRYLYFVVPLTIANTATKFTDFVNDKYVLYIKATPTTETLTPAQTQAFLALHSNKLHTIAYNDAGAKQSITYVADTKKFIENKFDELKNAIISMGGNV